jgi:O-methyltransferase domain/Dimerisation domain
MPENMPAMPPLPPQILMTQMLSGFQVSQALYVLAKLDVATVLRKGPRTIAELAAEAGANADALGRVIRFAASLGVFRTEGERVELTDLGAVLADDHPESVRWGAFYWMETHYGPFGDLLETVRTGESAPNRYYGKPFFEWVFESPDRAETQNRAFVNATRSLRAGLFDGYRLPEGNVVADLGGADGSMLTELLANEPDRRGIVFDRPEVVSGAQKTLADHGMAERVKIEGGDFFDAVPAADLYVLSNIMHDWDDDACRRILANVKKAANPGARVVFVESVIPPGDAPHPAKAFDMVMLAMMEGGRERSADEWQALLGSAGISIDRIVPSPTMYAFIEGTLR